MVVHIDKNTGVALVKIYHDRLKRYFLKQNPQYLCTDLGNAVVIHGK